VATSDRLAAALASANAPVTMVARARAGYYDDYRSELAMPINQLGADARAAGLHDIASRAMHGEFDGTKEESEAWMASPEGQAVRREFGL
jgi:hypothetical protein